MDRPLGISGRIAKQFLLTEITGISTAQIEGQAVSLVIGELRQAVQYVLDIFIPIRSLFPGLFIPCCSKNYGQ